MNMRMIKEEPVVKNKGFQLLGDMRRNDFEMVGNQMGREYMEVAKQGDTYFSHSRRDMRIPNWQKVCSYDSEVHE